MEAQTCQTKALVALENIADLPKGKYLTIHGDKHGLTNNLRVKHHASGSWVCWIERADPEWSPYHTRWSDNKGELLGDLEHFFLTDALPVGKVQGF